MGNIGSSELLLIFVLALLLLGPRRLPAVGEALGKTLRRFRQASRELRDELDVKREIDLRRDLEDTSSRVRPPARVQPRTGERPAGPRDDSPEAPEAARQEGPASPP